jgi:hypothetical protein
LKLARDDARLFPEDGVQASVLDRASRSDLRSRSRGRRRARRARSRRCRRSMRRGSRSGRRARISGRSEKLANGALVLELAVPCDKLIVTLAVRGAGSAWFDEVVLGGQVT